MLEPSFPNSFRAITQLRPDRLMIGLLLAFLPSVFLARWLSSEPGVEWMVVMCCLLFYCWITMIIGFFSKNFIRFLVAALICYVVLIMVLFFGTAFISGTKFYDFYAYNQFFKASVLFYGVGLFLALLMRSVVSFLEGQ